MAVQGGVQNIKRQLKQLKALQGKSEKVIQRTMSDVRTRVPGWVAAEVTKVYNIKKGEVTPAKAGKSTKPVGSIKVAGDTLDTMEIVYRGRVLTPTHFGMTPKAPKETYTLKAEILKGNKTVLGQKKKLTKEQRAALVKNFRRQGQRTSPNSPIMLMRTGSTYIPFQRKSPDRKDVKVIKTISMPQMVSSERTSENINRAITEGLDKRITQHMKILEK